MGSTCDAEGGPAPGLAATSVRRGRTTICRGGLRLDCGRTLEPVVAAWESYGALNGDRSNAILVCHALSGGANAAGSHDGAAKPGWWHQMIGPGKAFDTNRYCVICTNVLGSCYGTSGPASIDPATGQPFGPDFPVVTIWDMVRAQRHLLNQLGVPRLHAVAGGSMGGMQALAWSVLYPADADAIIAIASTDRHSPRQIAFNEIARRAVMADPGWNGGRYYGTEGPAAGLAVARMLGHVTYLSDASMQRKFGRRGGDSWEHAIDKPGFEVERYLEHQGRSFVRRFDANSLLYLTRAIDRFDLSEWHGSLDAALGTARARFLLLTFSSDWLYPPAQLANVATVLRRAGRTVEYHCLASDAGHDAFLVDHDAQEPIVRGFLAGPSPAGDSIREPDGEGVAC